MYWKMALESVAHVLLHYNCNTKNQWTNNFHHGHHVQRTHISIVKISQTILIWKQSKGNSVSLIMIAALLQGFNILQNEKIRCTHQLLAFKRVWKCGRLLTFLNNRMSLRKPTENFNALSSLTSYFIFWWNLFPKCLIWPIKSGSIWKLFSLAISTMIRYALSTIQEDRLLWIVTQLTIQRTSSDVKWTAGTVLRNINALISWLSSITCDHKIENYTPLMA